YTMATAPRKDRERYNLRYKNRRALSDLAIQQQEDTGALAYLEQSLKLSRELGAHNCIAGALFGLAQIE
ncbi:MAG TPA: hypothetical protein VFU22_01950, partial [Roseiflexaceae bacterium]|nr:hypothetical protein [Roseiflexaceae bacterium]